MSAYSSGLVSGKPIVIVTQCEFRFGYNVARSLVNAGYQVVAMAQTFPSMSDGLFGVVGRESYPSPFADPEGYLSAVSEAAVRWSASVFIPVHEDIFVASRLRDRLPASLEVAAPDFSALMGLHDKYNLFQISQAYGLECPDTFSVKGLKDVEERLAEVGDLAVLKPRHGEGGIGRKIVSRETVLDTKERAGIRALLENQEYVLQRHVPGRGVCIGLLAKNGDTIAISGHFRIREFPRSGGASTARRVFHDEALFSRVKSFVESISYTGVLMLEFRHDLTTGAFRLIDANPRYWGGLSLHLAAGIDYPALHVASVLSNTVALETLPLSAENQIESRWLLGELTRSFVSLLSFDVGEAIAPLRATPGVRVVYEDSGDLGARGIAAQIYAYIKVGRHKSSTDTLRSRQDFFHGPH
ncbi:ATP-grasp domain-containing protein [Luteimonas sp. XNQY3]|nr:ATP-grasp domain-containing protein [Luteimonas sp. XNQY3]MCD9008194.1 ATP-grasp domain-containing protein [Luteimonas sp. XNQY3]